MTSKLAIACGALGILVGVGATWLVTRPDDGAAPGGGLAAERSARSGHVDRAAPIRIAGGAGASADEIRTLVAEEVRAEVRAALRDQAAAAPAGKDVPAVSAGQDAPAPTPAFAQVQEQVAARLTRGAWSTADRDWMRSALGAVNDAERTALMRQVIVAANRGALRVELEGPLF